MAGLLWREGLQRRRASNKRPLQTYKYRIILCPPSSPSRPHLLLLAHLAHVPGRLLKQTLLLRRLPGLTLCSGEGGARDGSGGEETREMQGGVCVGGGSCCCSAATRAMPPPRAPPPPPTSFLSSRAMPPRAALIFQPVRTMPGRSLGEGRGGEKSGDEDGLRDAREGGGRVCVVEASSCTGGWRGGAGERRDVGLQRCGLHRCLGRGAAAPPRISRLTPPLTWLGQTSAPLHGT